MIFFFFKLAEFLLYCTILQTHHDTVPFYSYSSLYSLSCVCRSWGSHMWLLNGGPLLLPQSMKYHICLFRPCFPFLNSINIYIAAKGLLQVAVIDEAAQLKWKSFFQSSFFGIYTVHAYYSASSKQYFFLPFLCISYI